MSSPRRGENGSIAPDPALARVIDHTLLHPQATATEVERLCEEAMLFGFFAVCIQPCHVAHAVRRLAGSAVKVATVAAFPHGAAVPATKAFEAARARDDGAAEIDVVANLAWIRGGDTAAIRDELAAVVEAARPASIKVILETVHFSDGELTAAAGAALAAGVHLLKTSTGFGPGGATVEHVRLLRQVAGDVAGVKAAGGIRTRAQAEAMLAAGATRLGCSASVAIVTGAG